VIMSFTRQGFFLDDQGMVARGGEGSGSLLKYFLPS